MKNLNKVTLALFSVIILVIGVVVNLIAIGLLDFELAGSIIKKAMIGDPSKQIILVSAEICILLALLAIFIDTTDKKEPRGGRDVLMQNDNGKLMISRDTIENLAIAVVNNFGGVKDVNTKIALDSQNNVIVLVNLTVSEDVVIKELTINIQNKIKEAIKKTSDLEVKEVNVRIKNIESNKTIEGE